MLYFLNYHMKKLLKVYIFSRCNRAYEKIYNNEKSEYGFENNINKDIPPDDFIEICEVK